MTQSIQEESTGLNPQVERSTSQYTDGPRHPSGRAIARLPQQYIKVLTRPSVATFAETRNDAGWGIVWVQLIAWAILDGLLGLLVNLISPPSPNTTTIFGHLSYRAFQIFTLGSSIGLIIVVPILFFLIMGIMYLLAKAFGGKGTFLEQINTSLQIQVPLGILSKLLALIPVIGRVLNSVLSLYGIVLQVIVIMAVHRLSAGKAIAVMLLSGALALIPVGVFIFVILQVAR